MQPPTSQHDTEFGIMIFDCDRWVLERRAMLGNQAVQICVEPEEIETGEISPLQREALRQALGLPHDVLFTSAPVVLQNYQVYREAIGDDELPPLSDPVQVWNQVTFSYLFVPSHAAYDLQTPIFLLFAECSWDPEHGLEVRFRNGIADAASQQGDLGYT